MSSCTSFPILIIAKLLYLIPALFLFHQTSIFLKENGFLRNKFQLVNDVTAPNYDDRLHAANKILENEHTDSYTSSSSYTSEAIAGQITNLLGLTFTPSFNQFSGYLQVSSTRKIHYWYIESLNNPSHDPLVFWANGGPGCSGLLGLGTEMGPFTFNAGGNLTLYPFTWNNIANILYVEQPAGVGFRTFSDPDDANVGDERAPVDNVELIRRFFDRFPERKGNEFYIASESYRGHYIPHCKSKEILLTELNFIIV